MDRERNTKWSTENSKCAQFRYGSVPYGYKALGNSFFICTPVKKGDDRTDSIICNRRQQ